MTRLTSVLLLLLAATLEAGGDWAVRKGMAAAPLWRFAWFLGGALILFAYGWTVNRPPWSFGELIGVYVVFFFLVAQAISYFLLKEPLPRPILYGGPLIVAGGLVIVLSK